MIGRERPSFLGRAAAHERKPKMTQSTPQRRGLPGRRTTGRWHGTSATSDDVRFDEMLVPGAVPADLSAPLWMRLVPPQMKADPAFASASCVLPGSCCRRKAFCVPPSRAFSTAAEDPAVFFPTHAPWWNGRWAASA